jgi:NAD(P)-dependent dehydrogenase (short-subunit alcohol dehydrogenase family)
MTTNSSERLSPKDTNRAAAPFAIVTGASTGIGLSLAFECASHGYDLLIVADEPQIHEAARELQQTKVEVEALEADLATLEGVDRLLAAAMMNGDGDVASGWHNKLQAAIASVLPAGVTAELHRKQAAPGTADKK